jgi:lipopolysaccharide biosynthesis regulator YciM
VGHDRRPARVAPRRHLGGHRRLALGHLGPLRRRRGLPRPRALLGQAGRSSELAEILEQHLEIVSDPERRKTLTKRMAVLFEDALRNADKAVESWRAVLDVDDSDEEALDALARLYVAGGSWRELVEVYQRKIELAHDPQALRYLRFLSARVFEEKLEEPDEAASQLRAVLDANPGDADALAMLDRIFSREKQHFELLEILDLRVAGAEGPDQDALAFRAAELVEKELDDQSGAIARYRDIVSRSPGHDGARQALWKIARDESYRLQAVAALEPVLRSTREWTELVELQELRLEVEETPGVRLEILTEIARIREQEQNDSRRAFDAWALAFAEEPSEAGPREALERLAASTNEYAKLAAVYSGRLESHLDPELEQTLSWRLAQLYEEQLGEPGKAVEFLQRIVSVPGTGSGGAGPPRDPAGQARALQGARRGPGTRGRRRGGQRRAGRVPGQPGRATPVQAGQQGRGDGRLPRRPGAPAGAHQGAGGDAGAAGRHGPEAGRGRHPGAAGRGAGRLRRAGESVRGAGGPGGQWAREGAVVAPGGRRRRREAGGPGASHRGPGTGAEGGSLRARYRRGPGTGGGGRRQANGRRPARGGGHDRPQWHLAGRAGAACGGPVPAGVRGRRG